jgi:hypothetical protein
LALDDARFKLDIIDQTELVERQGAPGPMCFEPRIMGEPAPYYFQLARGARTYNGSTKPEDWLEDYSTVVNIAGETFGGRCVMYRRCLKVQPGYG